MSQGTENLSHANDALDPNGAEISAEYRCATTLASERPFPVSAGTHRGNGHAIQTLSERLAREGQPDSCWPAVTFPNKRWNSHSTPTKELAQHYFGSRDVKA